jgi:hypothetical protein
MDGARGLVALIIKLVPYFVQRARGILRRAPGIMRGSSKKRRTRKVDHTIIKGSSGETLAMIPPWSQKWTYISVRLCEMRGYIGESIHRSHKLQHMQCARRHRERL